MRTWICFLETNYADISIKIRRSQISLKLSFEFDSCYLHSHAIKADRMAISSIFGIKIDCLMANMEFIKVYRFSHWNCKMRGSVCILHCVLPSNYYHPYT
jgi:hypothetical protein